MATRDSHAWNTCGHKRAINIRYSPAINLQKHVEYSVHNCESHTRNALIKSHIICQGNGLIAHT